MSHPQGPNTGGFGQPGGQPDSGEPQQWGQPQTGGQPAQPAAPQAQQWGQPQTGGQPAAPQGQQWGDPQTGGQPAQQQYGQPQTGAQQWGDPQTGGQPAQQYGQPQTGGQPAYGQQTGGQQWGQPGGAPSWGQGAGAGSSFSVSMIRPGQWIGLILWLLVIIGLSIPFVSISTYGYSDSASGWNGGLLVMVFIFALLAAVTAATEAFAPQLNLPFPLAFVVGGLLALAGLFGIIEFLTDIEVLKYYSVGGWLMLVLSLVAITGGVLEIMAGLKAPKPNASGWGQGGGPGGGGQWGQPAQGQWGQPGQGGQAPQQGQWGQPGQGQGGQWGQ